ncbi:MAG: TonB-dependent receptor [Bacteroidaceae bacterium]|nr:TonB-dependent receptor [Bacteroidaceae bacterium]
MRKGAKLLAAALLLTTAGWAQTPIDSLTNVSDNADVTFTESQLGDEEDAAQTASTISNLRNDPFLSEVGYRFSPMRFRVRAYDNQYNQYYMNGLLMNDAENGRFSYGLVGGLNDATRNRDGISAYDYNNFGMTGVGGASNTNTRASMFMPGHKLTLSGTNRNYVLRGMYTYATGMSASGWAFAGTVGYRWAKEGVIEGTFYNSFSYLLSIEKRFNDQHSLSLVTFGAPTERGQQGASTEEAYWLANSHYYNPNWGYQNGKKRNSRVVKSFEPTTLLTWDWKIDHVRKLVTTFGFRYSNYGTTALGWNGDAYDPRPDYYKNLPSSAFNVYSTENSPEWLSQNAFALEQWQSMYDYWTASKANRQINWDRLYYVNRQAAALGQETLYYQERRHNDQLVFALSPTFSHLLSQRDKYTIGLVLNHTKGMHYKTMEDLLGGNVFTDVDKFAANDYGLDSQEAQNDLNRPNRQIREGDVFGYDYNIYVNHAKLWGIFEHSYRSFNLVAGAHIDGTSIEREGLMRNGRAPENSYGRSGTANFLGGGGKVHLAYRITPNHIFTLGGSYTARAPLARNAFVAPRIQNNFVNNLTTEDILSAELAYQFNIGPVSGKLTGYYTRMMNMVEQTAFYNDQESRFTYLTMSDLDKEYYGFEGALKWQVNTKLSFNFLASVGEAKYTNNPLAQVDYEGMNASTIAQLNTWINPVTGEDQQLRVFAKDMRVSSTPLTALSLGVNYNVDGWFLSANLNYYDRVYVGFSQYRRLSNVLHTEIIERDPTTGDYQMAMTLDQLQDLIERGAIFYDKTDGHIAYNYIPKQEKFDGGFMLDLSIGKYIRLRRGRSISINLSLNNVTNNRKLRTGGYEMNRDDYYNNSQHTQRAYSFSNNSKYYYANAFNAFLNIGYRF